CCGDATSSSESLPVEPRRWVQIKANLAPERHDPTADARSDKPKGAATESIVKVRTLFPIIRFTMAKARTQFLCNSCGSVHPKWMGKCPDCGTWDALEEFKEPTPDARRPSRIGGAAPGTGDLIRGA